MGALTFTIKINTDWQVKFVTDLTCAILTGVRDTLSEDDAQQLLTRLVEIYVNMAERNDKTMVLRKMSSTIVAYFLHKESKWIHCVKTLVASFSQHRFVQDVEIPADFEVSTILDQLSPSKVNATFLFCSSLVEETLKFDSKTLERYGVS